MKNLIFAVIAFNLMFQTGLFCQETQRSEAYNKYKEGEFEAAKQLIDECCINKETKDHPKTWYFKALIYMELAKKEGGASENYAEISYNAVVKSQKLDEKELFVNENKNCLMTLSTMFLNQGSLFYNQAIKQDKIELYKKSLNNFELFLDVMKSLGPDSVQVVNFLKSNNMPYTDILVYAGFAAYKSGNKTKAKKYYRQLVNNKAEELNYDKTGVPYAFITYCTILLNENNIDEAKKVIEKGLTIWPENKDMAITELKIYQKAGDVDALMDKYEEAVVNDPQNVNLLATLANKYDNLYREYYQAGDEINADKYRKEAADTYKRAIKLYPENDKFKYNLYYNEGLLFYNPAVDLYHKSLDIQKDKRKEIEDKYITMFKNSIDAFEKAFSIDNTDKKLIDMMVRIYLILDNEDRSTELQEHYKNLE